MGQCQGKALQVQALVLQQAQLQSRVPLWWLCLELVWQHWLLEQQLCWQR